MLRFLWYANGSAKEVDYQLLLAHDLDYIDSDTYRVLCAEVEILMKMLCAFIQTVERKKLQN